MNKENYLSKNFFIAIKYSWILFVIYFIEEFSTNYYFPEDDNPFLSDSLILIENIVYIVFFSWYFFVNKKIRACIFNTFFLSLFFIFNENLQYIADYYISSETIIDSSTLSSIVYIILLICTSASLSLSYMQAEKTKSIKTFSYIILANIFLLLLFNKNYSILDQVVSYITFNSASLEIVSYVFYFLFKSVQAISFLIVMYFLIGIILKKESIYSFTWDALRSASKYFKLTLFISISVLFFSSLNLFQYSISFALKHLINIDNKLIILNILISALLCILLGRFIGLLLYQRAHDLKKYYGIIGATLWVPFLNIISYTLSLFDAKLKLFNPSNKTRSKQIHLTIGVLLILLHFRNGLIELSLSTFLIAIIFISILFLASYVSNNQWGYTILSAILIYFITTYEEENYYTGLDLIKEYISAAIILIPLVYPAYYIINKSMVLENLEED